MFKTILFPVDRSRESQESAETVKNLVKTFNSRLVVLSVVEKTATGDDPPENAAMSSPEVVAQLLESAKSYFVQQGITVETIEREGMPSFTICDVADEIDADLIVMGCRGLGLTEEGAIESVTNRVINLAPCAVLIIP
ncbi:MAG: universal stress protein [Microcystaceae cyanobacterium]